MSNVIQINKNAILKVFALVETTARNFDEEFIFTRMFLVNILAIVNKDLYTIQITMNIHC